jgi:hypothetical protein
MAPVVAALVAGLLVLQDAAPAAASADSNPLPTVGANGDVLAITADAQHVYIAGRFTFVGAHVDRGTVADDATGQRAGSLARVQGGTVRAAVSDGRGGWYIGGDFTQVAGQPRAGLARITSAGTLSSWAPAVNGRVDALAFADDVVYVGGAFSSVGGANRASVAAVTAAGTVTPWNPGVAGTVRAIAVDATTVYVGGQFGAAGGASRANLAGLDVATGAPTPFDPGTDGPVNDVIVEGAVVHAGGEFHVAGGAPRSTLAAFGTDGSLLPWDPGTDGVVHSIIARRDGTAVYVAGAFGTAAGAARANIAAIDTAGAATPWNPGVGGTVLDMSLSRVTATAPRDAVLYVGGTFTTVAGASRLNGAGIDTTSGAATAWEAGADATVRTVARSGGQIYLGGDFTWVNGAPRRYVAALRRDTLELDRNWVADADAPVRAVAVPADGAAVYVGGEFENIGGAARRRLAALDPTTGAVTPWAARANNTVNALAVTSSRVFVGGNFSNINGTARSRIGAVDRGAGAVIATWNPGANDVVRFLEVSPDESKLYAGGRYKVVAGANRPGCAELSTATGAASTFAPNAGGDIVSMDLSLDGSRLWCSTSSNRTYAYAPATSNVPLWTTQTSGDVQAADDGPGDLYIGGHFSSIKGQGGASRLHAASVDLSSGTATAWNPTVWGTYGVWAMAVVDGRVLVGGDFDKVANRWQPRFAVFPAA